MDLGPCAAPATLASPARSWTQSATNLVESLTATFKIENNPPYLMYKNESGVRGIWFHQREDYDRIAPLCEQVGGALHGTVAGS